MDKLFKEKFVKEKKIIPVNDAWMCGIIYIKNNKLLITYLSQFIVLSSTLLLSRYVRNIFASRMLLEFFNVLLYQHNK